MTERYKPPCQPVQLASLRWGIGYGEYMPIRHRVLGPDRTLAALSVPGDEQARHVGVVVSGRLIGCLSLFALANNEVQLRKFAILPEEQGRGFGSFALRAVIERCREEGWKRLVLDARLTAMGFYEKHALTRHGAPFMKGDIAYVRMVRSL